MAFTFGGLASQPGASGSVFGSTSATFGQSSAATAPGSGLFSNLGVKPATVPSFGTSSVFGNLNTTTSLFPVPSTATTSLSSTSGFGTISQFTFPTKVPDVVTSMVQSSSSINVPVVKSGSTVIKVKENLVADDLHKIIFDMEDTIKKYQVIQRDAESLTLKDGVEWQSEMKRFDESVSLVKSQLTETFNMIDLLRKNSARLCGHNLLASRLATNPGAYYSVSSSVEAEVVTDLRNEMEILDEDLRYLEDLHEDLLKPGERYNPLDLQGTYIHLFKIVNGVAVAVDEVSKLGEEVRKEIQVSRNQPPIQGSTALQASFRTQDIVQVSDAQSLFTPSTLLNQNVMKDSKSPLLQPLNADLQFTLFNPAMRSSTRMDSSNTPKMTANASSNSPGPSRFQSGYSLGVGSPGF